MPRETVKRALQILLCLVTALELCGGHLGIAQIVAWAGMLRDYTAEKGFAQGVKETFDDEHPCAMCHKIARAKQQEERKAPLPLEKTEKISKWVAAEMDAGVPAPAWNPKAYPAGFVEPADQALVRRTRPPVPPPRALV